MTNDLKEIGEALKNKRIFLMPYCHADYAWRHPRQLHHHRYIAILDRVVRLFGECPEFRYFFDSWSELLAHCIAARPDSVPFLNEMLRGGRLAIFGGQWSNVRLCHVGDETSIRNIILGGQKIRELFPDARLDGYANLDMGIGHSQVPQLMHLGGYRFFFVRRPEKGLDDVGVPRSFAWQGISGHEVIVTRHRYGTWNKAGDFTEKAGTDPFCQEIDFGFTVRHTWNHYLRVPASQPGLKTLSLCEGADDAMPFVDRDCGFERDTPGLVKQWNEEGLGRLTFGTPYDVFDSLLAEKETLPVCSGVLDPAELCYHIARNGKKGLWWLRELCDRELLLAENLAVKASLAGNRYPAEALTRCWQDHLTYCTHAMEFLFAEDFDNIRLELESTIRRVKAIQGEVQASLTAGHDDVDPTSITLYNALPEERREIVPLMIVNVYNHRRQPLLKDAAGKLLDSQIVYAGPGAMDFGVLVDVTLPPDATKEIRIEWSDEEARPAESESVPGMSGSFETQDIGIAFESGIITGIENRKTGRRWRTDDPMGYLAPASLPQTLTYWTPVSFDDDPLPFTPESLVVMERGPLRLRLRREGTSGAHYFTQYIDLYRGRGEVCVTTMVDVSRDSTNIVLSLPLDARDRLFADIPFGVEERDVNAVIYAGDEATNEGMERRIPGILWGRSWFFCESRDGGLGLISEDGPRYYRRHGSPQRLLHFLVGVKPDRFTGWFSQTRSGQGYVLGRHTFHHRLVVDGKSWSEAEMVKCSQQARTRVPVFFGKPVTSEQGLSITPACVRLSGFYRDGEETLVRVVNMSDADTKALLSLPFEPGELTACNFHGEAVDAELALEGKTVRCVLSPWQIMTMRASDGPDTRHPTHDTREKGGRP